MDNITHTLVGVGLAKAGLSQRFGKGTTVVLAIASNLPDLDVAFLFGTDPLSFLWRRTCTHSVLGCVLLTIAGAAFFRRFYPLLSWRVALFLTGLGISAHVFADAWNSYGVLILWPFITERFALSWVYIIDLFLWGTLFGSLFLALTWKGKEQRIWFMGVTIVGLYVTLCASAHALSARIIRANVLQFHSSATRFFLYPEPFGPHRFRAVIDEGTAYSIYMVHPFAQTLEKIDHLEIMENHPIVVAARASTAGVKLDRFFSTPVWRLSPDGTRAQVYGLGFRSAVLKQREPFVFDLSPNGEVNRT